MQVADLSRDIAVLAHSEMPDSRLPTARESTAHGCWATPVVGCFFSRRSRAVRSHSGLTYGSQFHRQIRQQTTRSARAARRSSHHARYAGVRGPRAADQHAGRGDGAARVGCSEAALLGASSGLC